MKKSSMLDIMSQIDDSFIEEAAHPEILLALQRKKRRMTVVKCISGVAACAVVAVGVVLAIPSLRVSNDAVMDAEVITSVPSVSEKFDAMADVAVTSVVIQNSANASAENAADAAEKIVEAEKAAMDAADKASEAEKAAKDAAEKAAEAAASAAKASAESAKASAEAAAASMHTKPSQDATEEKPTTESEQIDQITYRYSEHVLLSVSVPSDVSLTVLEIPSEIHGEPIIALGADFWSFCASQPGLKQVTIPQTVTEFGNVSALKTDIEIVCDKGSDAEKFFSAKGYSVRNPK